MRNLTLRNWAEVDRALDDWRTRLQTVDDNLRELDDEPTLRKLEADPVYPLLSWKAKPRSAWVRRCVPARRVGASRPAGRRDRAG